MWQECKQRHGRKNTTAQSSTKTHAIQTATSTTSHQPSSHQIFTGSTQRHSQRITPKRSYRNDDDMLICKQWWCWKCSAPVNTTWSEREMRRKCNNHTDGWKLRKATSWAKEGLTTRGKEKKRCIKFVSIILNRYSTILVIACSMYKQSLCHVIEKKATCIPERSRSAHLILFHQFFHYLFLWIIIFIVILHTYVHCMAGYYTNNCQQLYVL